MDERFAPVAGVRLYESVVRQVLDLIARGEILPGSVLPAERDLSERLGVSRNVLREAFRVLEARGIVRSRQGGGRYVRDDNILAALPADGVVLRLEEAVISDVLESRELLEVQVALLAVERGTAEQIEALRRLCDPEQTGWEANADFHTAIATMTGNFMLERLVRFQLDLLMDVHQRAHYSKAEADGLLAEHRAIADAIAARDGAAAESAVRRHFAHTRRAVRR